MVKAELVATEIGRFPIDWEIVKLGGKSKIFRGGSPRPIQAYLTTSPQGVNWIKIGDVAPNAKYIITTEEKIVPEGVSYSRPVKSGDFILSNSMSFGRPYILKIDGCIHDGWLVIQNYQTDFDQDYLYYFLCSDITMHQYVSMAAGSSVQNLNKEKVKAVNVAKPPLPEQRAIAAALSDVDAYIAALEKLIDKKRAIKQGAMQELLSGKRRLPGFCGEWIDNKLDDLCYLVTKQTGFDYSATIKPSLVKEQTYGYIPFVQNKDFEGCIIDHNTDFYIPLAVAQLFPKILLDEPCLLISISGRIGNVGYCDGTTLAFIGGAVGIARFINTKQVKWVMMYLQSSQGQYQIFANEKAGAQHNLTIADIRNLIIPMPCDEEQNAIVEVLSDMDAEISALTAKLNKAKYIKQGMMSELLTGRIRLVEQEETTETVAAPKVVELPKQEAKGHNQQFDDAVMIAGIVNALYSNKYPLGRKKVQKCLYLLRRHQDESTKAFKKKAAGPYADEVRYKGGEPIARKANYIVTKTATDKGTIFTRGKNISQALEYIESWGKQDDIKWVADNLKYKKVDELELLATVDMAICDLQEAGTPVSVASIKHLIATNEEWKAKLKKQIFSDANIARAIKELQMLL